jgi:tripeptide aminopeptidase
VPILLALVCLCGTAEDTLTSRPAVKQAMDFIRAHHEADIEKQIAIAQIPAPGFHEEVRAAALRKEFERIGLADVEIDSIGNVLGWRRGRSPQTLVIAAHLDTVFPPGTDVTVKRTGSRLNGPGLVDDTRGLVALLSLAEAVTRAGIETEHSLLFVCDVGEEGLGSLRGIKYLFHEGKYRDRLAAFISIDGTDAARIVTSEMGSRRYRVIVKGPGGHSYGNFGRVNPAHALGRIIAKFAETEVPTDPKTTYNVGTIGGGTSVNSVPFEVWAEIDMRSSDEAILDRLEQRMLACAREGVDAENRLRAASGTKLVLDPQRVAVRRSARTAQDGPLVRAAEWATRAMGLTPQRTVGSTDSNVPMNKGIAAITVGGGGRSGNLHSLEEWFEPEDAWKAVQQLLLTVLAFDEKK